MSTGESSDVQEAITQIHTSPHKLVLEFAGAGSLALWWLHSVAGSSRTVLEATDRYAAAALKSLLHDTPEQFVSEETAVAMAQLAYERAVYLEGEQRASFLLGVGCTATIATTYAKSGEHHCVIALQSSESIATYHLKMKKGLRERLGEETLVSRLLVRALVSACNLRQTITLDLLAGEKLRENHHTFTDPLDLLISHLLQTVTVYPNSTQQANHPITDVLLSGSFNPLHEGHEQLATIAAQMLGKPVLFELPIINADKGALTYAEIQQRLQQFHDKHTVVLTRAPLFSQKAALFPGSVFIIGYDTAIRLVSPQYYNGEAGLQQAMKTIRAAGCRFLVAGRLAHGTFHMLSDIPIPPAFKDLFTEIPPDMFRVDISSTALRARDSRQ